MDMPSLQERLCLFTVCILLVAAGGVGRKLRTLVHGEVRSTKFDRVPVWPRPMANFSVFKSFDPLECRRVSIAHYGTKVCH
jgi:hypothetical protein